MRANIIRPNNNIQTASKNLIATYEMCFYSLACAQEERVLIICGKAVLTPSDGTDAVTMSAGDFVKFHKGFSCRCVR